MTVARCVVTGAGGFIGYRLANALAADGFEVVGVDRHFPKPSGALGDVAFTSVIGDFRDSSVMRRVLTGANVVFHLAAAHLQQAVPESEYWDVNVHSLPMLLEVCQEAGVTRFVHTSSVGVYGDVGSAPATEVTSPCPQSIYGETKLAGENAVLAFGRQHPLKVVVLRPAWVYGPGCPRTAKLVRALRERRFLMIGKGQNLRHPIYIEDMIEAFRLAATQQEAIGRVLLIAGERAVTTQELIDAVCRVFAVPAPSLRLPLVLGKSLAVCAESLWHFLGREAPFSRRTLEFFTTNNAFDTSNAKAILGFKARYSLSSGLAATKAWIDGQAYT
jgi:nucleoside-diphosphate-sugar epimerase